MTDTEKLESSAGAEFNLKHRVTGAGVLLFLGALVIPWLLGPPSEAAKQAANPELLEPEIAVSEIERDLLEGNEQFIEEPEETVYISKITPLNGQSSSTSDKTSNKSTKTDVGKSPSTADTAGVQKDVEAVQVAKKEEQALAAKKEEQALAAKKEQEALAAKKEKQQRAAAESQARKDKAAADKKSETDRVAQQKREKELQAALAAESAGSSAGAAVATQVDVGWIVQVGLYLEQKGASKKLAELSGQGFKPSSTVVDTNRGPKTGTRVWLGPFEKRSRAESQNSKLKELTGSDGFIRVYP